MSSLYGTYYVRLNNISYEKRLKENKKYLLEIIDDYEDEIIREIAKKRTMKTNE